MQGVYNYGTISVGESYFFNNKLRSKGIFFRNTLFNGYTYVDGIERRYLNGKN